MEHMDTIHVRLYNNTLDKRRTLQFYTEPRMTYLIYRRQLQLLGMRLMILASRQRRIPFTSYDCVKPGWVNPKECPDLAYEHIDDDHIRIVTIFGDVGEIEVLPYGKDQTEDLDSEDQDNSRVSESETEQGRSDDQIQ